MSWWAVIFARRVDAVGEGRMKAERREGDNSRRRASRRRREVERCWLDLDDDMVSALPLCMVPNRKKH